MLLTSIVLGFALQHASGSAADYFPLIPGDKWVYSRVKDGSPGEVTYTAQPQIKLSKLTASPLLVDDDGRTQTLYYMVDPDTVWLLGFDKDNLYTKPHIVLRVSGTWHGDYLDGNPVNTDSTAKSLGRKDVLGESRDVLEVTTKMVFGNTREKLIIVENAEYARGIGLIRLEMNQTLDREKQHELLTLKSFEPASKG